MQNKDEQQGNKGGVPQLLDNWKRRLRDCRPAPLINQGRKALNQQQRKLASALGFKDSSDSEDESGQKKEKKPSRKVTIPDKFLKEDEGVHDQKTRIHKAIVMGNPQYLQLCLEGYDLLNDKSNHFLHEACMGISAACVEELVNHGASINSLDERRRNPLHYAVIHNSPSIVTYLMRKGARVGVLDIESMTPLMYAAHMCHHECLKAMLEECRKDAILVKNREGKTVLHYAALQHDPTCLKQIIRYHRPTELDAKDMNQETPLHLAALTKCLRNVECLLEAGANPTIQSRDMLLPVHYSAYLWDTPTLKVLLDTNEVDVNAQDSSGKTLLHLAVMPNPSNLGGNRVQSDCVECLLEHDELDVNKWDLTKTTPLGYAVQHDTNITRMLLQAGANPNGGERLEREQSYKLQYIPPLHRAAGANQVDNMLLLLRYDAFLDVKDKHDMTALHIAAECENDKCIEVLLQYNANVNIKDAENKTVLERAVEKNNPQLVKGILEHAARELPMSKDAVEPVYSINLGCLLPSEKKPETDLLRRINDNFREQYKKELFLLPITRAYVDLKIKCLGQLEIFFVLLTLAYLAMGFNFLFWYANCLYKDDFKNLTTGSHMDIFKWRNPNNTREEESLQRCGDRESVPMMSWLIWMGVLPVYVLSKIVECTADIRAYFTNLESFFDIFLILSSLFLCPWSRFSLQSQKVFVIVSMVSCGLNFMMVLGNLTSFWKIQMMMFRGILERAILLLIPFLPLLICFSFATHTILQYREDHRNVFYSFITSMSYMVGSLEKPALLDGPAENRMALAFLVAAYLILVIIVMMNLLTGLAVNITDSLRSHALYKATQRRIMTTYHKERILMLFRILKSRRYSIEKQFAPKLIVKIADRPLRHLGFFSRLKYKIYVTLANFDCQEVWPLAWVGLNKEDIQTIDRVKRNAQKSLMASKRMCLGDEADGDLGQLDYGAEEEPQIIGLQLIQIQKKMVQIETILLKLQHKMEEEGEEKTQAL